MYSSDLILIASAIGLVAFLYSSVGHAGASGYIAIMTLFSLPAVVIKPTALALNIMVASIGAFQFWRAGHFSWRLFWPFALLSVPGAALGGFLDLSGGVFRMLIGIVLLLSALKFIINPRDHSVIRPPGLAVSSVMGAGLGLLSGLTGTGGGIFLTPILMLAGWAKTKTAASVSAFFILVNSTAGLAGNFSATGYFPDIAWTFIFCAVIGGAAGSFLGSNRFSIPAVKRLLAIVLTVAGLKLIFTE